MRMIERTLSVLCLAFVSLLADPAFSQELPADVRADLERKRTEIGIRNAISAFENRDYKKVLEELGKLKKSGIRLPPTADFFEAKAAISLKQYIRAGEAFSRYFERVDRTDASYNEAIELYAANETRIKQAINRKATEKRQAELRRQQAEDERQKRAEAQTFRQKRARFDEIKAKLSIELRGYNPQVEANTVGGITVAYSESISGKSPIKLRVFSPSAGDLGEKIVSSSFGLLKQYTTDEKGTGFLLVDRLDGSNDETKPYLTKFGIDGLPTWTAKVAGEENFANVIRSHKELTLSCVRYEYGSNGGDWIWLIKSNNETGRVPHGLGWAKVKKLKEKHRSCSALDIGANGQVAVSVKHGSNSLISYRNQKLKQVWRADFPSSSISSLSFLDDGTLLAYVLEGNGTTSPFATSLVKLSSDGQILSKKQLLAKGRPLAVAFAEIQADGNILVTGKIGLESFAGTMDQDGKLIKYSTYGTGKTPYDAAPFGEGFAVLIADQSKASRDLYFLNSDFEHAPEGGWAQLGFEGFTDD